MTTNTPETALEFTHEFDAAMRRTLTDTAAWQTTVARGGLPEIERWLKRVVHEIDGQFARRGAPEDEDPTWGSRAARMKSLCQRRLIDLKSVKNRQAEKLHSANSALRDLSLAVYEHSRGQISDAELHCCLEQIRTDSTSGDCISLREVAERTLSKAS
jgi:hypothetical protein